VPSHFKRSLHIYVKPFIFKKIYYNFFLDPAFYFLNSELCSNAEVRFSFLILLVLILRVYGKDHRGDIISCFFLIFLYSISSSIF